MHPNGTTQASTNASNDVPKYPKLQPQIHPHEPTTLYKWTHNSSEWIPTCIQKTKNKNNMRATMGKNKRQHATVTSKWKMCVFSLVIGLCNMYLLLVAYIYIYYLSKASEANPHTINILNIWGVRRLISMINSDKLELYIYIYIRWPFQSRACWITFCNNTVSHFHVWMMLVRN